MLTKVKNMAYYTGGRACMPYLDIISSNLHFSLFAEIIEVAILSTLHNTIIIIIG